MDRRRATATRSSATTPRTRATRPVGRPATIARTARRATACGGARWPSSTAPTPRAGCVEEAMMRVGMPVQGRRRHPVLRPQGDQGRARLPAGVVNPADEVTIKRVLNEPKRGIGDTSDRPGSTRGPTADGQPFIEAMRHADDAGVSGPALAGHRRRSSTCSTSSGGGSRAGPGRPAAGDRSNAAATSPSSRPSARSSRPAGSRTSASWSVRPRSSRPIDEFLEQVVARRRHRRASTATTRGSC